jgi:hypothetical protein
VDDAGEKPGHDTGAAGPRFAQARVTSRRNDAGEKPGHDAGARQIDAEDAQRWRQEPDADVALPRFAQARVTGGRIDAGERVISGHTGEAAEPRFAQAGVTGRRIEVRRRSVKGGRAREETHHRCPKKEMATTGGDPQSMLTLRL